MATATTEKLKNMVECPICFGKFNNPLALMCLHFYCEPCVHDLKPVNEGGKIGYNCPLCWNFTAKDSLRPMFFIKELLEVVELAEKEQMCDKCKSGKTPWRCNECKENFCQACRDNHDGFSFLKNHLWKALDENAPRVIDKHVYCKTHPEELVKLHCHDCQELMCILCNCTKHKNHSAQTISDALKQAVPVVKERKNKVEQLITSTEKALRDTKEHANMLNKQYEQLEAEIDQYTEEALRKVREDSKQLKIHLNTIKKQQLAEIEGNISNLEMKLKSQKNIVKLSDTTLTIAQGTSLLSAIQSGLGESLASFIDGSVENESNLKSIAATFLPAVKCTGNSVGDVVEVNDPASTQKCDSMRIPRRLAGLMQRPAQFVKSVNLGFLSLRFAKMHNQLWFVEVDTSEIHVLSMDGVAIKTVTYDNTSYCRSVAQVQDGVIIAARDGLFVASQYGSAATRVEGGDFCDVSVMGDKVYALDDTRGEIVILKADPQHGGRYVRQSKTSVHNYAGSDINTIQVTANHIYVALWASDTVVQHTHAGAYVATHGRPGTSNSQLKGPLLSGVDTDGVLLIADWCDHRLHTLSPAGEWSRLQLNGLGKNPLCAVMTDNKLLVSLWNKTYQEFSLQ